MEELPELVIRGNQCAFSTVSVKRSPSFLWFEATAPRPTDWVGVGSDQDRPFGLQNALTREIAGGADLAAIGIPEQLQHLYSPVGFRPLHRSYRQDAKVRLVLRKDCSRVPVPLNETIYEPERPDIPTWRYLREIKE